VTTAEYQAPPQARPLPRFSPAPRVRVVMGAMAVILILTLLGPYLNYKPAPFTGEGSPMRQAIYIGTLLATIYACRPFYKPRRMLMVPLIIVLALGWCWVSVTWSSVPDIALRRLVLTTFLIWTIFMAVNLAGYRNTLMVLRTILIGILAANFVAAVLFPHFGVHQFEEGGDASLIGAWRGVMFQKNFAGAVCAFTILFFAFDGRRLSNLLRLTVLIGSAYFLYRTESKTSMGILAVSMVLGFLYQRYNPAYRGLVIPAILLIGVALVILSQIYWTEIVAPFNTRDAFTGRVQIWPALLGYAADHWMTGTGYGSFWNIGPGSPIQQYAKGWILETVSSGHNGYLDLLIAIGIPGLVLVILATLIWPVGLLLASKYAPRAPGGLLLSIVIFCAGHNLTESSLFDRDTIVQIFLTFALAMTWRITRPAAVAEDFGNGRRRG
jgi:O-antigen ligase